jgi:CDP-diacylglycerol--glycerol-3-phosphate 3-phosphatidyltransferase
VKASVQIMQSEILSGKSAFYKNIPNGLSLIRMLLVLPFILAIHDIFVYECTSNLLLLIVFFAIIISDVADGYLARKLKCASSTGAKLDIVSDTLYTISALAAFAYFDVTPIWFVFLMLLKLLEFIITSKLIVNKQNFGHGIFFDKMGKIAVSSVMLLPGIFVFRCVITDYKIVMNVIIYVISALLIISFVNRIISTAKYMRA